MKSPQRILMLTATLLLVAGCNKGIQMADGSPSEQAQGSQGGGAINDTTPSGNNWDAIAQKANGKVEGSSFDGQLLIKIEPETQSLLFLLPIPFPSLLVPIASFDIPQLPGASVFQVSDASGSTSIAVRMPLKYMIKGAALSPYNTLPNGDPLPFMPVGENRGFAIAFPQTPDIKLNLYVSANAAAAFIEIPALRLPDEWLRLTLGFPIKNMTGTQVVGYMAFVPNKATFPSGVYVASRLPRDLAILIDELLRY